MSEVKGAIRYLISGKVQHVGFRDFVRDELAKDHEQGTVKNLPDGRVEATAVGDKAAQQKFRQQLEQGPHQSKIESVTVESAEPEQEPSARNWIIYTKDFSGLGWAKKLLEEGEQVVVAVDCPEDKPEDIKLFEQVGKGWVKAVEVSDACSNLQTDQTYNVFAENHFTEEADYLREQGRKVFGTSALSEKLEHDRQFAIDMATKAGLAPMPTEECSSREEGLAFLDAHADKAYVLKPDDGATNFSTFVPIRADDADANREVYEYLSHMKDEPGTYILQERIPIEDSLEANAELWLYEGEPILALLGLEVKRKDTYDLGEMAGCGGDFVQMLPLDCPLVQETIAKLVPFYREQKYTGFADINVIFTPDGVPHFLEVCNRFGYSAHVTLFLTLATDGFGNILADFIDGKVDTLESRFREGVGASLTLFLDHPRPGMPLHIADDCIKQYYPFDMYEEDGVKLLAGYSSEVGIFTAYGTTMAEAADTCLNQLIFDEAVSFPDMHYRMDLGKEDYYNAPILRYHELVERGLL